MNPFLTRVLTIASGEVGVREVGRNRGERVEMYLAAVGRPPGEPWCAAFVSWCALEAARQLDIPCPLQPRAGAIKLWGQASPQQRDYRAWPGAIFVIDHGGGLGHCGFVESVEPDYFVSIEGNTSLEGSREGDGVYRRRRGFKAVNLGYVVLDPVVGPVPEALS